MGKHIDTRIEYIYIAKQEQQISLILPPSEFDNNVLEFIKACPKDIIQLRSPVDYYEGELISHNRNCLVFNVVYDKNFFDFVNLVPSKQKVFVFLIDFNNVNDNSIIKKIKSSFPIQYIVSLSDNTRVGSKEYIRTPHELVFQLKNDVEKIRDYLDISFEFEISLDSEGFDNHNEFVYFKPAIINFCVLNQIIGNYWTNKNIKTSSIEEIANKSAEAQKDRSSKSRQLKLLAEFKS